MAGPIRAFFAVEIKDKKLVYAIGKLQEKLSGIVDRLKLVELENIHLTLRFLGDISELAAKKLYNFLEEEINSQYFEDGAIEFTVQKLSDFSKRVFHLGMQGPVSILREIHDKIDHELVNSFSFEKDRKFKSHITIARARKSKNKLSNIDFPLTAYNSLKNEFDSNTILGRFTVSKIYLKKSVLTPQGPIYSNLEF
jgi:2'-5' RNA ligase